jgi:lysophospholipase L1-like esterase|tara:strand:+ start:499 stop:1584 length:1086 start_codon:yes stop_codon:yes gene_type:complete
MSNLKIILNTFLIIFVLLLSDFIISKVYNKIFREFYPISDGREKNEFYHHTLKKNANTRESNPLFGYSSYKLISNSIGFRDKLNRKISNTIDKKRIIFIGDSFTEGVLLDYEDTFVGIIDEELNKKSIEVLNAGVASYSPIIIYHKIKKYLESGLEFDELIVFIDISDVEDEAVFYGLSRENKVIDKVAPLQDKEHIKNFKESLKKNFKGLYGMSRFISYKFNLNDNFLNFVTSSNYKRDKWTVDDEVSNEYKEGIVSSIKYINLLKNLCNQNNIKLTLAVNPWPTSVYYNDYNSKIVNIFGTFAKENNLQFINFFPLFISENDSKKKRYNIIKKYYIYEDVHFNKRGNKLVAEHFLNSYK